ncbi:MAG: Wzz/FepE/Etk N-terminal domain-containing protein [Gemmatimonadota bacterium]|nr:Wzz/FepE/Etk N-terminal domain-containing protein [Gemmatimonadota bacterium]
MKSSSSEAVDLREIGAGLRRGWRWIAGGALVGVGLGAASLAFLRPQFEATTGILFRNQVEGTQSILARLGGLPGGLFGGMAGASEVGTEVKILTSRSVVGEVVDSLLYRVEVRTPHAKSPRELFEDFRMGSGTGDAEYSFERTQDGFAVVGPGASGIALPGRPYGVTDGVLTLRRGPLPDRFAISITPRQEAIRKIQEDIAGEFTGEYVELTFRAHDPSTTAAVLNSLVAEYLRRRKTTDRGVNQHRYEFLTGHTDSIARHLAVAERELRDYQEASGVLDPELTGNMELERTMVVQAELEHIDNQIRAIRGLIERGSTGQLSARELAAYPTFLNNPAINDVLARLLELETERTQLLETRTERDSDVTARTQAIRHLEGRLRELGRDYLSGMTRQQTELRRALAGHQNQLGELPRHAEETLRRVREVTRLSETLVALQSQLVQARLGAISEGGEVRQIDPAVVPRTQVSPNPVLHILGGLLGGLFFGMVAALGRMRVRQRIHEPWEAEIATGLAALRFDPETPLAFEGLADARTLLLSPVGRKVETLTIGKKLAETATLRGNAAVLIDFSQGLSIAEPVATGRMIAAPMPVLAGEKGWVHPSESTIPGPGYVTYEPHENGGGPRGHRMVLSELEGRFARVVAVLPEARSPGVVSAIATERPLILAIESGSVTREELIEAVDLCVRLGGRVAGVVVQDRAPGGGRR